MSHNPQHYDNFVRLSNTVIMLFMRYNLVEVNMPDSVIKNMKNLKKVAYSLTYTFQLKIIFIKIN